jgi:hypothetical protein
MFSSVPLWLRVVFVRNHELLKSAKVKQEPLGKATLAAQLCFIEKFSVIF